MEERLNKWLSRMGVCSRREADRLISEGKVLVDGKTARSPVRGHPPFHNIPCHSQMYPDWPGCPYQIGPGCI